MTSHSYSFHILLLLFLGWKYQKRRWYTSIHYFMDTAHHMLLIMDFDILVCRQKTRFMSKYSHWFTIWLSSWRVGNKPRIMPCPWLLLESSKFLPRKSSRFKHSGNYGAFSYIFSYQIPKLKKRQVFELRSQSKFHNNCLGQKIKESAQVVLLIRSQIK